MLLDDLRSLYPNLSEEELAAAKENLEQYLLLAWEIIAEDYQGPDNPLVDPRAPSP